MSDSVGQTSIDDHSASTNAPTDISVPSLHDRELYARSADPSASASSIREAPTSLPVQSTASCGPFDSSDEEPKEIRVVSPPFETWYDDWNVFFARLQDYQDRTKQLYSVRSTVKATTRNAVIKAKKKWSETELIPESFGDYYKKMLCTHGWNKSERGDGRRTGHRGRSTGCGVVLCATVTRCPESLNFRVKVTVHKRVHNHRLGKDIYDHYPVNRRVTDPDVLDIVDELVKAGGKPKKILKYLQETTGKSVTLRDVHNLVQRLKARRRGIATVEDRLEAVLRKFCAFRGNTASIFVDETETTQTITLQTRQMHRFFEAFPEVLMLDSTHGTNVSKYKLFSFMIEDVFGHVRSPCL
ncbi:hypothetical protein F444_09754 [Phytophthora nicotianae P1976]|uniref:ZSWIM1/3 RNaseH-like domain-containing protein n=1 Tax=Phytophthora nicotianae P1976 TaxID=1317066 RepID=A0A081A6K6_PHYNI|nr:hypothetical protein F444_09754 [Phytophthora nicotianae P1976]